MKKNIFYLILGFSSFFHPSCNRTSIDIISLDTRPCCLNDDNLCDELIEYLNSHDIDTSLYSLDKNGCPIVKEEAVLVTDQTFEYIKETQMIRCPCDPTLILVSNLSSLDSQQLEEIHDVAESGPGSEGLGNNYIRLPDVGSLDPFRFGFRNNKDTSSRMIKVAVLDSGVDTALFRLIENRIARSTSFVSDVPPYAIRPIDNYIGDDNGHGSLVTKIIDDFSDEDDRLSNAKFYIFRTHNRDGITTAFSAACALRCAEKVIVQMVNLSWGTSVDNYALRDAIQKITTRSDMVIIASKGNDCQNTDFKTHYPSDYPNVIGIAGLDTLIACHDQYGLPTANTNTTYNSNHLWAHSNRSYVEHNFASPCIIEQHLQNEITQSKGTSFAAPFALANGLRYIRNFPSNNIRHDLISVWNQQLVTDRIPCEQNKIHLHPILK